ncbi:DUF4133 domain-containing protein [Dyadobacter sp. CY356]|uniref:DUF4133 domain-containing protein n=1 Tax=Dyadobacter sp. CY356 TaxID=2906442 RepID=UPI001F236C1A|nr:DUF4133 domain-containing protein [Dyadobacter sp. CY356]MCF0055196.1 DUF4133 domain-containing protein [Dyadobacter sp. CY356]
MLEPIMAESCPDFYLDNVEILSNDQNVFTKTRVFKRKHSRTCRMIRAMIAKGLDFEEIIDQSVELITEQFRPSRFGYVCALVASEFPETFLKWVKKNALGTRVTEIVSACEPLFGLFKCKAKDQHRIYLAVTNFVRHYLTTNKKKTVFKPNKTAVRKIQVLPAALPVSCKQTQMSKESELRPSPLAVDAQGTAPGKNPVTLNKIDIMANKQYMVNKGINKSLVFKGLKAQYIGYMGLGLLIDLLFYAALYILKVNTYITLVLTAALGALITIVVYHLNGHYGEHGLVKKLAQRKIPKMIRSFSRRIFR